MKIFRIIFLLLFFPISCFSIFAQENNDNRREIWLFNLPTPHTLQKKMSAIDLSWRFTKYGNRDPRTEAGEMILNGIYGLSNRLNIYFIVPYGWISSRDNGISDVTVALKYSLIETNTFIVSLAPSISLPAGNKDSFLGGDEINYQLNTNIGFQKDQHELMFNIDYGYKSHLYPPNGEFTNQAAWGFSGAIMVKTTSSITLVFEGIWKRIPKFSDDDLSFHLGGIFKIKNSLLLKSSYGFGLPRDIRSNIDQRATMGLCYYFLQ